MQFEHDSAGNRLRCFLLFLNFPLFFLAWWISCLFPFTALCFSFRFLYILLNESSLQNNRNCGNYSREKKSFSLLLHIEYLVYSGGAAERLSHRQERRPEEPTT